MKILEISGLQVRFTIQSGTISAVDTIDFSMDSGEACALVGESGCGKSVLGMAVMRILPSNAVMNGTVRYKDINLTEIAEPSMLTIRGGEIAMIPQNSAMVLNPVMTIGHQATESVLLHRNVSRKEAENILINLLISLKIENPARAMRQYPHEFSGGMRERILIAMVMAAIPSFIIADEPTAGLDLLIRNQTLDLLKEQISGKTLLLITHDLGSAYHLCSRIIVMYAGEILESGPTKEILSQPRHPYTIGLLASVPSAGLHPIPGMSPSPGNFPKGCRFYERCPTATGKCLNNHPGLRSISDSRQIRCLYYDRT